MKSILIIDDEKDIVDAISYNLTKEGYSVSKFFDGLSGFEAAKQKIPDLIILDLMLPMLSGIELFKLLKKDHNTENIPVIMLSAKGEESDKVLGLELGADDYLTKPFGMKELLARIKTTLKRFGSNEEIHKPIIKFGDLEINLDEHIVKSANKEINLTSKEFQLLVFLAENKERVYSRDKLLEIVWGIDTIVETRTVDVHIRRLREKLGKSGKYIKTLHGVGYKFSIKE